MKDRAKHLSKKQRREEMMARANRGRQGQAPGPQAGGGQDKKVPARADDEQRREK